MTTLLIGLLGCFGDKRTIVISSLEKSDKDVKGIVRLAERIKVKVFVDEVKGQDIKPAEITVGPEYVLVFKKDFNLIFKNAVARRGIEEKLSKMLKDGKISKEMYDEIIQSGLDAIEQVEKN